MLGIGPLEIAVILLVAFLVLGPSQSIDLARNAGKIIRDLRASFTDVIAAVDLEQDDKLASGKGVAPPGESEEYSGPRDQQ